MDLDPIVAAALADRAGQPSYDEWSAVMAAAYDHNGNNIEDAVAIADEIVKAGLTFFESIEPTSLLDRFKGGTIADLRNERESGSGIAGPTEIHFNPSHSTIHKAIKASTAGNVRMLVDHKNAIAWDGEQGMHTEVANALGIGNADVDRMHQVVAEHQNDGSLRLFQLGNDASWVKDHPQLKRLGGSIQQVPGTKGPSLVVPRPGA